MMYSGYVMQRKKTIIVICSMIFIPDNLNQENQWILSIGCFKKKRSVLTVINVSSNCTHGKVYSIQHCVVKFVSNL